MKMKVFGCVLLAVLVVGGLAFAGTDTWPSSFTLGCTWLVESDGNLDFSSAELANATDPEWHGEAFSDAVTITISLNCHLNISATASENFVGTAHGDTMNALWYGIVSYDGTPGTWYSSLDPLVAATVGDITSWDKDEGGSGGPDPFYYPGSGCDGTGYLMIKVSVDRDGWHDWADTYTATMTLTIAAL